MHVYVHIVSKKYSFKIKGCICVFVIGGGTVGVGGCVYAGAGEVRSEYWMRWPKWPYRWLWNESSLFSPSKYIKNKPKNLSEKATPNMLDNNLCSVDCFFLFILVPQWPNHLRCLFSGVFMAAAWRQVLGSVQHSFVLSSNSPKPSHPQGWVQALSHSKNTTNVPNPCIFPSNHSVEPDCAYKVK